jgi:hypothetical protein
VAWQEEEALRLLARFFSPARVFAFESIEALKRASAHRPTTFGRATALMKIDVSAVEQAELHALAATALVAGGLCFALNNHGAGKFDGADPSSSLRSEVVRYWQAQLRDATSSTEAWARAPGGALQKLPHDARSDA